MAILVIGSMTENLATWVRDLILADMIYGALSGSKLFEKVIEVYSITFSNNFDPDKAP